ncbi:MAG: hypothetical protein GEV28_30720 [Actinophytocola sp.]|nr:DUF6801 domain-containing protein [Actinophytocola sp.]MPZ84526.1 hypothetical protein [Actinophytocola sp.]
MGEPIQPTDVTATVTAPNAALADFAALHAATVAGTAELTTEVSQGADAATVAWSGLDVLAAPVPDTDDLVLAASGAVAPVTVSAPGDVTLTAGALVLDLSMYQADGSATDPAGLSVACRLDPGQDGRLATIAVPDADLPSTSGPPTSTPDGGIEVGPPPDGSSPPGASRPRAGGEPPPGCFDFKNSPTAAPNCAYMAGYSNVAKLHGSVLLGVGPDEPNLHISLGDRLVVYPAGSPECPDTDEAFCRFAIDTISSATLDIPAARATFLAFGFMPVTATMKLTETAYAHVVSRSFRYQDRQDPTKNAFPLVVTSLGTMSARIYDVAINGISFDVGPACRPEDDLAVELHGHSATQSTRDPDEYTVPDGGPQDGMSTIPPFSGCRGVTGENLDLLFTGMVSGPGNYVKMTQGAPCPQIGGQPTDCPPVKVLEPQR